MQRSIVIAFALGTSVVAAAATGSKNSPSDVAQVPPVDSVRRSADWLGLLPDGEEKRRFILDCTGCHQLDDQVARPGGVARTAAQFNERIEQMLSFAGSTTGFPVIGHGRNAATTSAWLAGALAANPIARPRGPLPANARITEYDMPEAGDLPHDVQ